MSIQYVDTVAIYTLCCKIYSHTTATPPSYTITVVRRNSCWFFRHFYTYWDTHRKITKTRKETKTRSRRANLSSLLGDKFTSSGAPSPYAPSNMLAVEAMYDDCWHWPIQLNTPHHAYLNAIHWISHHYYKSAHHNILVHTSKTFRPGRCKEGLMWPSPSPTSTTTFSFLVSLLVFVAKKKKTKKRFFLNVKEGAGGMSAAIAVLLLFMKMVLVLMMNETRSSYLRFFFLFF